MFVKLLLAALSLKALLVSADPTPSVPGPGDSYREGGDCQIGWGLDPTGKWTDMQIELKTGDNWQMVPLKVITTIDATKETQYTYPCPKVSPNSAIYFYEFTSSSSTEKYWTTRFTITDENGNSTPPSQSVQQNGDKIPWGTGTLVTVDDGSSPPGPPSDPSSDPSSDYSSDYSSDSSSLSLSPSSSLPGSSNSILSSSSRLSSTRTPSPTQTGSNTTSSQSNSNGDMAVAVSNTLVFAIGLVTSTAFFL